MMQLVMEYDKVDLLITLYRAWWGQREKCIQKDIVPAFFVECSKEKLSNFY